MPAATVLRLLFCLTALTTLATAAQPSRPPNILLIITDDQGYGDLGCHGNDHVKTPNIDRLAAQSVQMTNFIVSPVCTPTRASLMTGRYNFRTGAIDTYQGRALMHNDETTLAEILKPAGYRTALFGKWHLGDNYPMRPQDQGFDEVLMHRGGGMVQPADPPNTHYMDPVLQHNGRQELHKGYCTDVFATAAISFIEQNRQNPFFLYLATNAPHTPLEVPDDWVKPYKDLGLDDTTAKIYAMVENIDKNVGRILQRLDELKLADDTIVIYMHDNGPQQKRYNANLRGLKGSPYEGGIRSPLFLRWGNKLPPRKLPHLCAHIDLMPTLLDLAAVPPPAPRPGRAVDGISIAPLLLGHKVEWIDRTIFSQWHRGDEPKPYDNAAVRTAKYKLVNGKELYDLESDSAESRDVAADHPKVVADLRARYDRWFADVTSEKRFAPFSKIVVGAPEENPSTLTRQDWRGPKAAWTPLGVGHWDVRVARPGRYNIRLRFPPVPDGATAHFKFRDIGRSQPLTKDQSSLDLPAVDLPAGDARVDALITTKTLMSGVHYIDIERLPD